MISRPFLFADLSIHCKECDPEQGCQPAKDKGRLSPARFIPQKDVGNTHHEVQDDRQCQKNIVLNH